MPWFNELSVAGCHEYLATVYEMEPKVRTAFTSVMVQLRLRGSLLFDEKSLARIGMCTPSFWRNRAWPSIEYMFDVRDGRLYHPEVESARDTRRQVAARVAANARWGGRANLSVVASDDAPGDASGMPTHDANASESHAGNDAISTTSAFESHSLASRTDSLSLSSSFLQTQEESRGEGESARERAGAAGDANGHASDDALGMRSHDADASADPPKRARTTQRTPLSNDWKPSPDGEKEARALGFDPAKIADDFRLWNRREDSRVADWDAAFILWCRKQVTFDPRGTQTRLAAAPSIDSMIEPPEDQELRRRFRSVVSMRGRNSVAPLAPTFDVLRKAGASGLAWLSAMEGWEANNYRGEAPAEFTPGD